MLRPEAFQKPQVVLQNTPYVVGEKAAKEASSGGLLSRGRIVWTQEPEPSRTNSQSTIGFLDGVGIISLNPQLLIRADVLNGRRR
jgi:hypothetical protein